MQPDGRKNSIPLIYSGGLDLSFGAKVSDDVDAGLGVIITNDEVRGGVYFGFSFGENEKAKPAVKYEEPKKPVENPNQTRNNMIRNYHARK